MNTNPGTLVISLDFELLWGIRDFAHTEARKSILATRQVVPKLLDLFHKCEIHATWATVGFLFFESRLELMQALPEQKPAYVNHSLSPYEWMQTELGANETADPLHYAPSLVQQILRTPNQELATHTFSHYYCLEDGQTPDDFEHDLRAALNAARKFNYDIRSIVFPRNQYNDLYLEVCARNGLLIYRGTESVWFRRSRSRQEYRQWYRRLMRLADAYINISGSNTYPTLTKKAPINLPSSRYLRPYSRRLAVLEPLRLKRILTSLTRAARNGEIFHLWWHPEDFSENQDDNFQFLNKILLRYQELRQLYGMRSQTMGEIAVDLTNH